MGHKRKKRYQSKGNPYPPVKLTGRCRLLHWEESYFDDLMLGDLKLFMHRDSLGRERDDPGYEFTGGTGYLKVEIYDGKAWQPVIMDDVLPGREHHFSKTEAPLDTYLLCADLVTQLKDSFMRRTYRSHYEPISDEEAAAYDNTK